MTIEPFATALLLTTVGTLLAVSVLFSRAVERVRVPLVLIFLVIGMLAGSEGIGRIAFEDYRLAYRLGTAALVLILFDGGLNTPRAALAGALGPASALATLGVVLTAGLAAVGARLLGVPWPAALVLGAVVSSTDAAAVLSVLRSGGIRLKKRVAMTLEVESGLNDPMAIILTTVLVRNLAEPGTVVWWRVPLEIVLQLAVGAAAGLVIGLGGRQLFARLRLAAGGLYVALSLALACLAFGVPTLVSGSGFLAVYVAAVVLGDGHLPYRAGLLRAHDALAWLSQISMFLMLGLLVFPSRLAEVWPLGLALAGLLVLVARPAAVAACLWPWRFPPRELVLVSWVGLRGAVPIILATFPVMAGAPGAEQLFDTVFFTVVASAVAQGGTAAWFTTKLGLAAPGTPSPPAVLEIASLRPLRGQIVAFHVDEALAAAGARISELRFPAGTTAMLIVRGEELIAPKGSTVLQPGDHVYVLARPEDQPWLQLMLGRPEGED